MRAPKRPHILYVEDDDDSCHMMSTLLGVEGIDVTCAHGFDAALLLSEQERFDLFLLDLWLRDCDGNALCIKLRRAFPDVPVVFYTGCATEQEKQQGLMSGAAAYLVKPYSELIAPLIFKLVTGACSVDVFDRPVDPLQRLEQKARKMVNIMKVPGRPMPLSP